VLRLTRDGQTNCRTKQESARQGGVDSADSKVSSRRGSGAPAARRNPRFEDDRSAAGAVEYGHPENRALGCSEGSSEVRNAQGFLRAAGAMAGRHSRRPNSPTNKLARSGSRRRVDRPRELTWAQLATGVCHRISQETEKAKSLAERRPDGRRRQIALPRSARHFAPRRPPSHPARLLAVGNFRSSSVSDQLFARVPTKLKVRRGGADRAAAAGRATVPGAGVSARSEFEEARVRTQCVVSRAGQKQRIGNHRVPIEAPFLPSAKPWHSRGSPVLAAGWK